MRDFNLPETLQRYVDEYRKEYIEKPVSYAYQKKMSKLERFMEFYVPQKYISLNWQYSAGQSVNWIRQYAYRCLNYVYSDFDGHFVITGEEGTGKSSFVASLIDEIHKIDPIYRLDWKNVFYYEYMNMQRQRDRLNDAMTKQEKTILWVDEARGYLEKRQFASEEQIELIQSIIARRSNNNLVFWCIGDLRDLDIDFRERKAHEIVKIPDRGMFSVRVPKNLAVRDEDKFGLDASGPTRLDYLNDISREMFADNVTMVGFYPDYNGPLKARYEEEKKKSRYRGASRRLDAD